MRVKITPKSSLLEGTLAVPSSKSHTLRAIIFATLAEGTSRIHHFLDAQDSHAMLEACRNLGAQIHVQQETLLITGTGKNPFRSNGPINAKNSGLVLRFLTALSALGSETICLTGTEELCQRRSVKPLLEALKQLGASVTSQEGFAPLSVKGPITKKEAFLCGRDSQMVSALLLLLSFCEGDFHLCVTDPGETPWIDLSLDWLLRMGKKITHQNYSLYWIHGEKKPIAAFEYSVPADFSSLAFPLLAGLLHGKNIQIENVDFLDVQGDKKIVPIFEAMGGSLKRGDNFLLADNKAPLQGISQDVNSCIDALPVLCVAGCFAKGKTVLYNAAVAREKESDRIHAMALELKKMGANIVEKKDGLDIGHSHLKGAVLNGHSDHRVAMALAIAALRAEGESIIEGFECVAKTYPNFIKDLQHLGVGIEVL